MKTKLRIKHPGRWLLISALGFVCVVFTQSLFEPPQVTKQLIARSLTSEVANNEFPPTGVVKLNNEKRAGRFAYTIDFDLQKAMENHFKTYRPDYGVFVALEPETGALLAFLSYEKNPEVGRNLALKASFPAASVFKIVTAAAAIDQDKATPNTVLSYTGANHTLYKQNLKPTKNKRWVRKVKLREAFARSINSVFGKLGIYTVTKEDLADYAERFQFNKEIPFELPVESGTFKLKGEDPFSLAEIASGFNRNVLMSPVQGAVIAGAIANDGLMMEPYFVDGFTPITAGVAYLAEPQKIGQIVSAETAKNLRLMMQDTVRVGTSRKSFAGLFRKAQKAGIELGGKTGSLTGSDPPGKYDWFVGYAKNENKGIAFAVLTIHKNFWTVKSSYLANRAIFEYFSDQVNPKRKNQNGKRS